MSENPGDSAWSQQSARRQASHSQNQTLWQSFASPTEYLLPYCLIGTAVFDVHLFGLLYPHPSVIHLLMASTRSMLIVYALLPFRYSGLNGCLTMDRSLALALHKNSIDI